MTTLERLLLSSEDELERALLGSAVAEAPSSASLEETALALGLTASATALLLAAPQAATSAVAGESAVLAAPLGASATATGVGVSGLATGAVSVVTVGKSLAAGALASFLALTAADYTVAGMSENRAVPVAVSRVEKPSTAPAPSIELPPSNGRAETSPVAAAEEPTTPPRSIGRAGSRESRRPALPLTTDPPASPAVSSAEPASSAAAVKVATEASLAEETRLLDRARSELSRGETAAAAAVLAQYAARPHPVLSQEAALLRVRLLLATGRRAAAAQEARRIISSYPENAHADSLRRLAAEP